MFALVLVLWLGFGLAPKLVVIALVSFFPIVVTTLAGLGVGGPRSAQADADVRRATAAHIPARRAALRRFPACSPEPRSRSPSR